MRPRLERDEGGFLCVDLVLTRLPSLASPCIRSSTGVMPRYLRWTASSASTTVPVGFPAVTVVELEAHLSGGPAYTRLGGSCLRVSQQDVARKIASPCRSPSTARAGAREIICPPADCILCAATRRREPCSRAVRLGRRPATPLDFEARAGDVIKAIGTAPRTRIVVDAVILCEVLTYAVETFPLTPGPSCRRRRARVSVFACRRVPAPSPPTLFLSTAARFACLPQAR